FCQADDGIRDFHVTGVQTCALPIYRFVFHWVAEAAWSQRFHFIMHGAHHNFPADKDRLLMPPVPGIILASILFGMFYIIFWIAKSEERRVGKEWECRRLVN